MILHYENIDTEIDEGRIFVSSRRNFKAKRIKILCENAVVTDYETDGMF